MEITACPRLTFGLICSHREPTHDPAYRRQPIQLMWQPDADVDTFVNQNLIEFPEATVAWDPVTHGMLYLGNSEVFKISAASTYWVDKGTTLASAPMKIKITRTDLSLRHGGNGERAVVFPDGELSWPARLRRNVSWLESLRVVEYFDPERARRERGRVDQEIRANAASVSRAIEQGFPTAQDLAEHLLKERVADCSKRTLDHGPSRPVRMPNILGTGHDLQPRAAGQTIHLVERKKAPPTFWEELEQAMSRPRDNVKALSPTMPHVEATPAGAEELIDWLRAQPDRPWAAMLSIPRVVRFLREKETFARAWSEEDIRRELT